MGIDGWREVSVADVASSQRNAVVGGPFGSNLTTQDYVPFGIPVIRGENLGNNRFIGGEFVFVSRDKAERLSANKARPGDIVFTQRGNAVLTGGQVAIVPPEPFDEYIVSQSQMKLTVNTVIASISYLYYVFRSREHREYLRNHAVTTGVPHTNLKTLRDFQFLLPPLPEQCAIADVLGTLDNKFEQNRRTSRALERLARAIFRAWFVTFEPVHAKAAGATSFPSMSQDVFDSLPTAFTPSDLGPIPEGWITKPLYETAQFVNGAAFRGEHFCDPENGVPVIKIAELKAGITNQTKYSSRPDLAKKYYIDTGDILYSWSGSPDTSLDTFIWTKGPGLLNQHIFRILTGSHSEKYFVYYLLKHLRPELIEVARNKQTTGLGHVTVADMKRWPVCWPDDIAFNGFAEHAGQLYELSLKLTLESDKLAELREYLLPNLLSGKVQVGDAARLAESVA
jgi:type I restriction enzyme S subunit